MRALQSIANVNGAQDRLQFLLQPVNSPVQGLLFCSLAWCFNTWRLSEMEGYEAVAGRRETLPYSNTAVKNSHTGYRVVFLSTFQPATWIALAACSLSSSSVPPHVTQFHHAVA